jgi:hypothetical protein
MKNLKNVIEGFINSLNVLIFYSKKENIPLVMEQLKNFKKSLKEVKAERLKHRPLSIPLTEINSTIKNIESLFETASSVSVSNIKNMSGILEKHV